MIPKSSPRDQPTPEATAEPAAILRDLLTASTSRAWHHAFGNNGFGRLYELAWGALSRGDWAAAIRHFDALLGATADEDRWRPWRSDAWRALAIARRHAGDADRVLAAVLNAVAAARQAESLLALGQALEMEAALCYNLGKLDRARANLDEALDCARRLDLPGGAAVSGLLAERARVRIAAGDLEGARTDLEGADFDLSGFLEQVPHPPVQAARTSWWCATALLHQADGAPDAALHAAEQAIQCVRRSAAVRGASAALRGADLVHALHWYANFCDELGDPTRAAPTRDEAMALRERWKLAEP